MTTTNVPYAPPTAGRCASWSLRGYDVRVWLDAHWQLHAPRHP